MKDKLYDLPNGNAIDPDAVTGVLAEETNNGFVVSVIVGGQKVTAEESFYPSDLAEHASYAKTVMGRRNALKEAINARRTYKS